MAPIKSLLIARIVPAYMQQLNGRYFNFDRLGIAYINENLPRLRQAYAEFVLEK